MEDGALELGWGAQEEAPASGSMEAAMMESTMYLAVGSQGWLVLIPAWGGRGRLLYERGIFSSWSGDGGHPPSGNSGSSLGLLGRWEAESLLFGDLELEFRFSLHALSSLDHILRLEKKKSQDWWALLGVTSGTLCHQTGQYFTQSTRMVGAQLVPKDFCEERLYTRFLFG